VKTLALVLALSALPAAAQTPANDIVTGFYGISLGIPCITFAVLTAIPTFSGEPARKGFVINSIVFGAIAATLGGVLTYVNTDTAKEGAGWIAVSAGVLCIGVLTAALGLFEMVSMRRDGIWNPPDKPETPQPEAPPMPPPTGPVPVVPTLAPTLDGHGVTLGLGGRF
jgi:hypothetical protein